MDRAALPRGALEDLVERAEESRAGFRDGEPHARRPARADGQQEGEPRVLRLGVHHVDAQDAPPAAHVAADAVTTAALDVGRVEPDVGHWGAVERPCAELLDVGFQARRDGAHLSLGSLETPIFSATLCTLRVPVACISAAATRARSTRW